MRARLKKLADLFVVGRVVDLPDGSHLWVQALNPYEREDCTSAATLARARVVMALRQHGDERTRVEGHMAEVGLAQVVTELADLRAEKATSKLANQIRDDPDWRERMDILDRTDFDAQASTPAVEELQLLTKINEDFFAELERRREEERELAERELSMMTEAELTEAYLDAWLDARASRVAQDEFNLTEMAMATRYCEVSVDDEGRHDHSGCQGHSERVFADVKEAKEAPEALQRLLRRALQDLAMSERDPKGSGKPAGSSGSSSTPSAPEASTPSTSSATPPAPPGTSSQPSLTLSPS